MDFSDLTSIRDEHPANDKRLLEVLKLWIIAGNNTTWKAIVDVLKSGNVNRPDIARKIEEKYCKD